MRTGLSLFFLLAGAAAAATFGTVVPVTGDPGDIALDEARGRVYILNTTQERVDIYSIAQKRKV